MLSNVKGRILWNLDVKGQTLINGYFQSLDEILAYWYPSHSSFLKLLDVPLRLESFEIGTASILSSPPDSSVIDNTPIGRTRITDPTINGCGDKTNTSSGSPSSHNVQVKFRSESFHPHVITIMQSS